MFQTFEPLSDRGFAATHVPAIRAEMAGAGVDGFIIPHDDEYQNEYIPAYAERLMWATGFSGSAGAAVVMKDRAAIFVDGRYTVQVRDQVDDAFFDYVDITEISVDAWLAANAPKGARIGYDPMLHSAAGVKKLAAAADKAGFTLVAIDANPVDKAWTDQPAPPAAPARAHAIAFSGQAGDEKRSEIAAKIRALGADAVLITAPPSVAWLFNIRGGDVARTPLPLCRAIVRADGSADLFIAPEKVDDAVRAHLGNGVRVRPETDIDDALGALGAEGARVAVDPTLAPAGYLDVLRSAGADILHADDPCALPRACKNAVEQDGARQAHIRDGAAVTRFLHWLATSAQTGGVDEITAAKQLEAFRRENADLVDLSFDTISGAGANGAVVHYRVSTETNRSLSPGSLFLVDSGAQYPDGTTDITRTVPIGEPTAEMRDRFTRVLKGHIALATARFPEGTSGHQLDALARRPLWEAGLDYDHGTGHGVGSFLGVHEGPQRIAKAPNAVALRPGMMCSNEPGYYKAGAFGIRIENLVIVQKADAVDGAERAMLAFETITLAPLARALIVPALLTETERHWVNDYQARVRQTLSPLVPDDVGAWLASETRGL